MAKWQDVLALARYALENNREQVVNACRCIIANESDNSSLKVQLTRLLARAPKVTAPQENLPEGLKGLVLAIEPELTLDYTELPVEVKHQVDVFLEDRAHAEAIHSAGLSIPHKILLSGPPGNGKTTLAGAIASELRLPLFVVDFSHVISSHLGESGANLAKIFRGAIAKPCVLFLDEMETLLSERAGNGTSTDVGEMRRVVSTLLMEIDRLPDHVILIGATNHGEMLDRAVVRRFDFHWELPCPNENMVQSWLQRFAKRYPDIPIVGEMPGIAADGKSLSDIEREVKKWCRQWIVRYSGVSRVVQAERPEGDLATQPATCAWQKDNDPDRTNWQGSCGIQWMFTEEGPAENGVKFCPRCGQPVELGGAAA